jgi:hypothetical protein
VIELTSPVLPAWFPFTPRWRAEVWRDDGEAVEIFGLTGGQEYALLTESRALPGLTGDVLTRFVQDGLTLARPEWLRAVRVWARDARAGKTMNDLKSPRPPLSRRRARFVRRFRWVRSDSVNRKCCATDTAIVCCVAR